MAKATQRLTQLTSVQQRHFINVIIPGRIRIIDECLKEPQPSDPLLAAAAIHTRALAGFLGVGLNKGVLSIDHRHYDHGGGSYEVKISDLANGALFTTDELSALNEADKEVIRLGFDSTNREFAHLTFWGDTANQDSSGGPNDSYRLDLTYRVRSFAESIKRLVNSRLPDSP
jgi:hypothetical protein